jgi:hypothetical protein
VLLEAANAPPAEEATTETNILPLKVGGRAEVDGTEDTPSELVLNPVNKLTV